MQTSEKNFGICLAFFRHQTVSDNGRCLSQQGFAEAINSYDKSLQVNEDFVYKWEKNKRKFKPDDRKYLLAIVYVLVDKKGINLISEANQLVLLSGLKALEDAEIARIPFPSSYNIFIPANTENQTALKENSIKYGGGFSLKLDPLNFSYVDTFSRTPRKVSDGELIAEKPANLYLNSHRIAFGNKPTMNLGLSPILPTLFVGREKAIEDLRQKICLQDNNKRNIQVITAVRGWPGVGKTTLASVLSRDDTIVNHFSGCVLWVSLGVKPKVLPLLISWGTALGIEKIKKAKTSKEASGILSTFLRDKESFLVIDDVWEASDALYFMVGGDKSATLVTTRIPSVTSMLTSSPDQIYVLEQLDETASLEIISTLAPIVVKNYPQEIHRLIEKLEGLPLALRIAGMLLQTEFNSGFDVKKLIEEICSSRRILMEATPDDPYTLSGSTTPTVENLLYRSLDSLDQETIRCFALLGVLAPAPASFRKSQIETIWQCSDAETKIKNLIGRGLLEYNSEQQTYQMHSLLVMLAQSLWDKNPPSE